MRKKRPSVCDQAVKFVLTRNPEDLGSLTGADIAREIGVNPIYLLRKFKGVQKIALKDFIVRQKIHTAVFILEKHQEPSVEELAKKLGFLNLNQFNEAFRNYIGVEPRTYQNLIEHRNPKFPNRSLLANA